MGQQSSPGRFLMLLMMFLLLAQETGTELVGRWKTRYVSEPEVQKAAQFAVSAYNRENKIFICLLRVLKARSQLVKGVNYRLTVKAVSGPTIKGEVRCQSPPYIGHQVLICKFEVWSRPWLNNERLTSAKCARDKR